MCSGMDCVVQVKSAALVAPPRTYVVMSQSPRLQSESESGTVTVRYFDNGTRAVLSRAVISKVEGESIPDSGRSKLVIGCFISGRDVVVIDTGSPSGESANAMPSAAATSPPSGSRSGQEELLI